jgi:hypothetical protein
MRSCIIAINCSTEQFFGCIKSVKFPYQLSDYRLVKRLSSMRVRLLYSSYLRHNDTILKSHNSLLWQKTNHIHRTLRKIKELWFQESFYSKLINTVNSITFMTIWTSPGIFLKRTVLYCALWGSYNNVCNQNANNKTYTPLKYWQS